MIIIYSTKLFTTTKCNKVVKKGINANNYNNDDDKKDVAVRQYLQLCQMSLPSEMVSINILQMKEIKRIHLILKAR